MLFGTRPKNKRRQALRTVSRVCMSAIFVQSGWSVLRDPGHRPQLAAKLGIPHPEPATTLTRANGGVMAMSGAALALGLRPRVAASVLTASLVPTTLAGHRFWEQEDAQARTQQRIHFLKNVAMMGGLLFVAVEADD
jgi:putative oxidoreductase